MKQILKNTISTKTKSQKQKLNRHLTTNSKESESVIRNLSTKKSQNHMVPQTFKEVQIPTLLKLL